MTRQHRSPPRLRPLCAEVDPDDGLAPPAFFRPTGGRKAVDRQALQLCGPVASTRHRALVDRDAALLRNLHVLRVSPAPDTSQLLVIVAPVTADAALDPRAVLARLAAASGRLRAEGAAAITRRRAPKLLFQLAASHDPTAMHDASGSDDREVQP